MLRAMPTATRATRRLGAFLRKKREAVPLIAEQVGRHLDQSPSTVSRYELGTLRLTWPVIKMLLALYGHTEEGDPVVLEAWALYQATKDEPKPVRLPKGASPAFRRLVQETFVAKGFREIATNLLPGMLQTEGYMRALAQTLHDPSRRDDKTFEVRKSRQRRLDPADPNPIFYHAVLDEICLTRLVGGPAVMLPQLRHVLHVAEDWDNVTVQAVPKEAGDYGAATGGLTIVDYEEGQPSWAYFEYQAGADLVENEEDVLRFAKLHEDAARVPESPDEGAIALSPDETIKFIRRQIEVLETR
ncbi:Helix-turn-helix domain-containing protein [Amycolatopsis saalfeldensis]|uniref:Helix-turn-helix domain-containing protein n=2 Tax=Amycolatopsis saalfeldensis TaxID=394193 RepID=A0A1H8YPW8_9PSEU|nr:Helix-turn-helix domain-containing protein [Amycolatopsis saalfeldensis]